MRKRAKKNKNEGKKGKWVSESGQRNRKWGKKVKIRKRTKKYKKGGKKVKRADECQKAGKEIENEEKKWK